MIRLSELIVLFGVTMCPSCATRVEEQPTRAPRPPSSESAKIPAETLTKKKMRAPVRLALTASGTHEALTLTLRIEGTAEIPRAVSRFVLPDEVRLVSGSLEQELGPLALGAVQQRSIVVKLDPTNRARIAAGVDCHLGANLKPYGVTHLTIGPPALEQLQPPGRDLRHEGIVGAPARPKP